MKAQFEKKSSPIHAQYQCTKSLLGTIATILTLLATAQAEDVYEVTLLAGQPGSLGHFQGELSSRLNKLNPGDGPLEKARFIGPSDLAIDAMDNIYIATWSLPVIRKITPDGQVTTIAGNYRESGFLDGPGDQARLGFARGITSTPDGIIYFTDTSNQTIRKIDTNGYVSTLAGAVGQTGNVDGAGSEARFNHPISIAVDSNEILYVVDQRNERLRRVDQTGSVTTLAEIGRAEGIFIDSSGDLIIGSWSGSGFPGIIRKYVVSAGEMTTIASRTSRGDRPPPAYIDGPIRYATFYSPTGFAKGPDNTMFIAETDAHVIRKVDWDTGMVSTVAGKRLFVGSADGQGESARFNLPVGMVTTSSGNIIVADRSNASLRQVTPDGIVTTFAGLAGGFEDGPSLNARFYSPGRMALSDSGELYIVDSTVIRKYHNGRVETIAGLKGAIETPLLFDVPATEASLRNLHDIYVNQDNSIMALVSHALGLITPDGKLLKLADKLIIPPFTSSIRTMDDFLIQPDGSYLFLTYGQYPLARLQMDGTFITLPIEASPEFSASGSFAKHPNGDIYVANASNKIIRKIDPDGKISFVAGKLNESGFADGQGEEARFGQPKDICWDGKNSFLITDGSYGTIRKLSSDGAVTTPHLQTSDGKPFYFVNSSGILCDKSGTVYVSDLFGHSIYQLRKKENLSSPKLHVFHQEGRLFLEWQDSTGDFKLEESSHPNADAEWDQATGSIDIHEMSLRLYRIEPNGAVRYFRLKKDLQR